MGWPQDLGYAASVVSQVGDALAHAHRLGMVHRDVKPGNILMVEDDWPLLSDFGLVKMVADSTQLTASGASVGTPQYMSPEQAQGMAVDGRSDIYCLGAVLYEAVTGRPPFTTDSPMAVILMHINEPLTPPRTLRPDLPKEMERVIVKALAKSPADRYQRMEEFLADLREASPLPAGRAAVHRGSGEVASTAPAPGPSLISTTAGPSRSSGKRSFSWTGVAAGVARGSPTAKAARRVQAQATGRGRVAKRGVVSGLMARMSLAGAAGPRGGFADRSPLSQRYTIFSISSRTSSASRPRASAISRLKMRSAWLRIFRSS